MKKPKNGMRSGAANVNDLAVTEHQGDAVESAKPTSDCYMSAALSDASKLAYANDLADFTKWGGAIPATPEKVIDYLTDRATILAIATLQRRVIAIGKAHTEAGFVSPCRDHNVKRLMAGIRRTYGTRQVQSRPVLKDDLLEMLVMIDQQRPVKAARDRALILVGFAGAFRRAELVAIHCEDIAEFPEGLSIEIRKSKTDQEGKGRSVFIAYATGSRCPVLALKEYRTITGIASGWLFRGVNRHDQISEARLTPQSVSLILKSAAKNAGSDASAISGHSLRSGYCTQAAIFGLQPWQIREQTGHKSDLVLARYIRPIAKRKLPSLL